MRIVSWIIVVGSLLWLGAGAITRSSTALDLLAAPSEDVAGTVASGDAAETASVAYSRIYPGLLMHERAAELDRIDGHVLVRSTRPDVATADIELRVDDGERVHRFSPGPRGEADLPARADWNDAGLTIYSNQPPETLRFSMSLVIRELPRQELDYRYLLEIGEQVQAAMDAMAEAGAGSREVLGLALRYPPGTPARVRVISELRGEEFLADARGVIQLPFDEGLREENPTVVLEPLPSRLMPLMR